MVWVLACEVVTLMKCLRGNSVRVCSFVNPIVVSSNRSSIRYDALPKIFILVTASITAFKKSAFTTLLHTLWCAAKDFHLGNFIFPDLVLDKQTNKTLTQYFILSCTTCFDRQALITCVIQLDRIHLYITRSESEFCPKNWA